VTARAARRSAAGIAQEIERLERDDVRGDVEFSYRRRAVYRCRFFCVVTFSHVPTCWDVLPFDGPDAHLLVAEFGITVGKLTGRSTTPYGSVVSDARPVGNGRRNGGPSAAGGRSADPPGVDARRCRLLASVRRRRLRRHDQAGRRGAAKARHQRRGPRAAHPAAG